eukprot:6092460-Amphidinium_carterae.1
MALSAEGRTWTDLLQDIRSSESGPVKAQQEKWHNNAGGGEKVYLDAPTQRHAHTSWNFQFPSQLQARGHWQMATTLVHL